MKDFNVITACDSYKLGHWKQYPEGTQSIYSYFESRIGAKFDETVFFGLQYLLKKHYLDACFDKFDIMNAETLSGYHFGMPEMFNHPMWDHILNEHGARLPLEIRAVPEGMPVKTGNVLMTVENTCLDCAPLTNHLETVLTHVWYSSTVATLSREVKKIIKKWLEATNCPLTGLDFMLHDFGARGVSSVESASIGGAAHLVNFKGTDTIVAMETAMKYYNAKYNDLAFSVPATEHSVMTSMGREGERTVFKNILDKHPKGILSVVIDSYNYRDFIEMTGEFREQILNRDGILVYRPDSGDPQKVTLNVVKHLGNIFGIEYHGRYTTINPKVRVLWGDGIDIDGIDGIFDYLEKYNWAADVMACFGMGGGLLQKVNRDLQKFAFKCSAQQRYDTWYDIWKDPVDGSKTSKKGKLALIKKEDGSFETVSFTGKRRPDNDLLELVFKDGVLYRDQNFTDIRSRASI